MYEGECGQLKGTAAGFLNPDPQRQFIEYFSTDICRPIRYGNIYFSPNPTKSTYIISVLCVQI